MAIEMRIDQQMNGVKPPEETKTITSFSKHTNQTDILDDILSMFTDDSSTIASKSSKVLIARENIHSYEKASTSKLHGGKIIIIKLSKERTKNVTQTSMKVNFTIMKENENETYLGNIIGNNITDEQMFDKAIRGIEN